MSNVNNSINNAQKMLVTSVSKSPKWKKAKETCQDVYDDIPEEDKAILQSVIQHVPKIYMSVRSMLSDLTGQYNFDDSEDIIRFMRVLGKNIKKHRKHFHTLVQIASLYEDNVDQVLTAGKTYIECLISQLPENTTMIIKEAIKLFVPGNTITAVDKKVRKMMEKEMIGLGLFTEEDVKNQDENSPMYFKYFMHGMNHFIGLDVHDVGDKEMRFEEGMVLTCEPGLYIKEENLGIRIENDILITEDGPVNLMEDIPSDPDEIEELMNKK